MTEEKILSGTEDETKVLEIRIFIDALCKDFIARAGHFELANILKDTDRITWKENRQKQLSNRSLIT